MIVDDELRARLVDPLDEGVDLFALMDSCHSGTVLDLGISHEAVSRPKAGEDKTVRIVNSRERPSRANVIEVSGCEDSQTSADAYVASQYTGALTFAFLHNHKPNVAPLQFLLDITAWLRTNHYSQRPLMSFGKSDEDGWTRPFNPF